MNKNLKKIILIFCLLLVVQFLNITSSYAYLTYSDEICGGFWQGLWHGLISFIKLPLSVLLPQPIHMYNLNNNGFMYGLGFFIPAIFEIKITIPLLCCAWIIRIIFWIIVFIISVISAMFSQYRY